MRSLLCLLLSLIWIALASAACIGSSPNLTASTWADVTACHTAASNGDTITVTSGSYTVTANTAITKWVTIVAGSGGVTLTDNTPSPLSNDMVTITESTVGSTKFSGFTIAQGTAVHDNPRGVIRLVAAGSGKPILIANNSYSAGQSGDFIIAQTNQGVIWANTITGTPSGSNCTDNVSFVRHKPGNGTWASAALYGTADTTGTASLYVEHNTIVYAQEAIDLDDDARMVFRYNTITDSGVGSHGVDTSSVGGRYMEVYNNTFVADATPIMGSGCPGGCGANWNGWVNLRGGTALIHDNVIPPISTACWGAKSGVTFAVEELHRADGSFGCYGFNVALNTVYPAPRQIGWGYATGATQADTTGVFQDLEPVYLWNNTGGGDYSSPGIFDYTCSNGDVHSCAATCPTPPYQQTSDFVQVNREYYLSTSKPGYFAYTYPHPLTMSSGLVVGTVAPPAQTGFLLIR